MYLLQKQEVLLQTHRVTLGHRKENGNIIREISIAGKHYKVMLYK